MMKKKERIFIAGKWEMVDTAIQEYLQQNGFNHVITSEQAGIDLTNQRSVTSFFKREKPDYVFLTGGKHGGILANRNHPAEFIYDNIQVQVNVIHNSQEFRVKKMIFLASSCIYPKDCPQPMKEKYLLSGELEGISEPYAIAKISGLKMCQAYNRQFKTKFICAIPATIFGPGDNFSKENSHVLPALLRKFYEAKKQGNSEVRLWGSGNTRREFLFVKDLARACMFLMQHYNKNEVINIGYGTDLTIRQLAQIIKKIVGYKGKIIFDESKPSGAKRKLLDMRAIEKLGWKPQIKLRAGIALTYDWYRRGQ